MSRNLDEVKRVITDPNKLKYVEKFPEEILGLIVQSWFTNEDSEKLRKHSNLASKIRVLHHMKAVDYQSPQHKLWAKEEEKFRNHKDFIPFKKLINNQRILSEVKYEEIDDHPRYLNQDRLGIEIIGAIPKRENGVEVLVAHNQIRWLPPMRPQYSEEMTDLDSKGNNIPKQVCRGELKIWNPLRNAVLLARTRSTNKKLVLEEIIEINQNTAGENTYFFTMPPLDRKSNYWDVIIPT